MSSRFDADEARDPIALFRDWFRAASESELNDPNAMSLATASAEGRPSVRIVLLKRVDEAGFVFYTNAESRKGVELLANPFAALCFHWKSLGRQVRVEGTVAELPGEEADAYFHSRSRRSQIGALASQQSRPLESRERLEELAHTLEERYPGEVPRPGYWRGYVVRPETIEFWQDGPDRLHDRMVFRRVGDSWGKTRLFP
ncbi:MAG TPA: pyridoxamine 5'-phosphate oxidase [Granulicella sp.]|jgi:pyridoxamine 5'-phosphate oxidase|nr:pyridoxamine 5'-phosphate oxidase [Granulicella sp.]